jgi:gamma-glutamyltranspeptidase/glutathione hydrolase
MGRNGMIATSQPLASAAGLKVLQDGGNAIDAAVTAAAVLSVVEPHMTGVGGDAFAIVYDAQAGTMRGFNGSGRAGRMATPDRFAARGLSDMPAAGAWTITVPGVVDAWAALLSACGTITMARALEPAIDYAVRGFAVSEIISRAWQKSEEKLASDAAAAATFLPGGRAPRPGETFSNPSLAATLRKIAASGRDAFYHGDVAAAIVADLQRRDAPLDISDFAAHRGEWVRPISTSYRGYALYELPPNTQGFVTLEVMNILEGFDIARLGHNSAEHLHLLVEAKRIAFADRGAFLADPGSVPAALLETLISKQYAAARRNEIDPARAARQYLPADGASQPSVRRDRAEASPGLGRGDTVYLTAADGRGNVISLIQSLFSDFGSGIVAGETGVALHNRGSGFVLTPGHPNRIGPGKRPLHTLVPALVMKAGKPWLSYGVMGADHQAQGHVQVLVNAIDFGMNVQEAGEAARINHSADGVQVESAVAETTRAGLTSRGHRVSEAIGACGGYQGIMVDIETGVLMGGSDPRKDGLAIGC